MIRGNLSYMRASILALFFYAYSFHVIRCYRVLPAESENLVNTPVTVCYVSTWAVYRPDQGKFGIEDIDPSLCTHLVYAFAGLNESSGTIRSLDPFNDLEENYGKGTYKKMTSLKSRNPNLKVTLAIGGWNEGSERYSSLVASPAKRKSFVDSVVAFLKKFDFDGLDLDWEYPGKRGGKAEDKKNFVSLIQELRMEMDRNGWILTAALGAARETIDTSYDLPALNKYLDLIHLMCYDYHGSWDLKVRPNAPLRYVNRSDDFLTVESSVKYLLANGVSPYKLVLGLPFYGRTFVLEDAENNDTNKTKSTGFHGPFTREDGFFGYNEICSELNKVNSSWNTWWDEESKTVFAKNNEKVISFDNARSLKEKVKLAASHQLAGIMVWSIDTDDFNGYCKEKVEGDKNSSATRFPLLRSIGQSMIESYIEQKKTDYQDLDNQVDLNRASSKKISCTGVDIIVMILLILLIFI